MSTSNTLNKPTKNPTRRTGQVVMVVFGAILALSGIGSLIGAGVLGWANATQRDSNGYFSTTTDRFTSSTHAITADRIDLNSGAGPGDWFVNNDNVATVRIRAKTPGNVFVGIAPQADVDRYLTNVSHDEITRVNYRPFSAKYRLSSGTTAPTPPAKETFWVAQASGAGTQTLTWTPTQGAWAVVVMNADTTQMVKADIAVGVRVSFLGPIISGLIIGGFVILILGAALLIAGVPRSPQTNTGATTSTFAPGGAAYSADSRERPALRSTPVRLEGHLLEPLNRWLWLVKWILLVPHMIALAFLWTAFVVLTIVAGVAIVFTGQYPRSIFDFNVGVLRWTWRVQFYGPNAYGTDIYPPFALSPTAYPATLDVEYPEHLLRSLVFVKSWLLAIPHLIIVGIFSAGGSWDLRGNSGGWTATQLGFPGGLIGICAIIGGVVLLIRRSYPEGLFNFIMGMNRWVYRVIVYVALMTDEYPPFHFDTGPTEPRTYPPNTPYPNPPANSTRPGAQQPILVGNSV
jgi:Domain of unknown function (DUF4389)